MLHYPNVNWGRGRLLPYESAGSFAAKFCRLNGIGCLEFEKFMGEFKGDILKILDEEESITTILKYDALNLPGCFGTFKFHNIDDISHKHVSYCPDCIKIGYHASFHEFSWLKLCPIHRVNLITEEIGFSRKGSSFWNYVKKLELLFEGAGAKWLSITQVNILFNQIKSKDFQQFENWIQKIQEYARFLQDINLVSLSGSDYQPHDLDILLGRIAWKLPIQKCTQSLFSAKAKILEPTIVYYRKEAVNELASVLTNVSYSDLTLFYKINVALKNERPKYRELMLKEIVYLEKEGRERPSRWGWIERGFWCRTDPDGWPYWQIVSPCQYAASELSRDWADMGFVNASKCQRMQAWKNYHVLANSLQKHGYVLLEDNPQSVHDGGSPYYSASYEINFDANIKGLIEDLIYEEAISKIEEIRSWLESLDSGAEPNARREYPSRGNLFLEADRAYLCTWPVEYSSY